MDAINSTTTFSVFESKEQMYQVFVCQSISAIKEICKDHFYRMANCKKDLTLLDNGVFYGNDYYLKLKEQGQTKRLEFLKNKDAFYHGYLPGKMFKQVVNSNSISGYEFNHYVIQPGKAPSKALDVLFGRENLVLTGCGEVCESAYNRALLYVLGEEKFNYIFSADGDTPLSTGANFKTSLQPLFKKSTVSDMQEGDQIYFSNVPFYGQRHINGEAKGFNTFYIGGEVPKFLGFGLNPEGAAQKEIRETLRKEYNRKPIGMEIVTNQIAQKIWASCDKGYMQTLKQLEAHLMDSEEFSQYEGGKMVDGIVRIDSDKVWSLYQADLPEARRLMKVWMNATE